MYKKYASSQYQCCSFSGTVKEVPSKIPKIPGVFANIIPEIFCVESRASL